MEGENDKEVERYTKFFTKAREAGCPKDQIAGFVSRGYVPLPWQLNFHAICRQADHALGPVDIGVGGARGPGKSHAVMAQIGLDDCQRMPRLKALFLRQTGISAKESFEDLIIKVFAGKVDYNYNRASNTLSFPNGSRVLLGGFKDDKDIDKYIGIEYDLIAIEEVNQLTKEKVTKIRGSLRTSKDGWRPRMYTSFNPGGIGHSYVKERYIQPHRIGLEHETRFIPSTYKDNAFVNAEYRDYLESLSGDLGKAWREGEWDLFAGQYFAEWREDIHVCEPFAIPKNWKRFLMGDYGYKAPSAVLWGAVSPEERVFIYRELYVTEYTYSQLVDEIIANTPGDERIDYWVFDPAIWARKGEAENGLSGAEIMQARYREVMREKNKNIPVEMPGLSTELMLKRGMNERIIGWQRVREYLKPYEAEGKVIAKVAVFNVCKNLIRTLPALIYDDTKVEDVDTTQEDHAPDALRYGLNSGPTPYETTTSMEDRFFRLRMKVKKDRLKEKRKATKSFYS